MYYRYKVKKKDRKIFKKVIVLVLAGVTVFYGYRYRQYLQFWKYSYNKLNKRIEKAVSGEKKQKKSELLKLARQFEGYQFENPTRADGFFMAGKIYFLLAESGMAGSFSERIINGSTGHLSPASLKNYLLAVKNIKKGIALKNGDSFSSEYTVILAKSLYYLRYETEKEVAQLLKDVNARSLKGRVEDVRFLALITILNGDEKGGFQLLEKHGAILDSIQGRLFFASVEMAAKRYTNAIMNFKDVLARTDDVRVRRLIHINLGKIYYRQSLYRESLAHFSIALKINENDNFSRIWIGKNYSAMGYKDRARAIWSEVLATDRSNSEVRKLLGVM